MDLRYFVVVIFISSVNGDTAETAEGKISVRNTTNRIGSLLNSLAEHHDLSSYFDSSSLCYKSVFGDKRVDTKDPKFVLHAVLLAKCVVITDILSYPSGLYRKVTRTITDIRRQDTWTTFLQQMALLPVSVLRSALEDPSMTIARIYVILLSCVIAELLVLAEGPGTEFNFIQK